MAQIGNKDNPSEDEGTLLSESVTAGDTLLHVENTHNFRKGRDIIVVDTMSTSMSDFETVVAKEVFFDSIELADPIGRDFPTYSWVIMLTDVPTPAPTNSASTFEAPILAAVNEDSTATAISQAPAPVVLLNREGDEVAGFTERPAHEAGVSRGPAHKEALGTVQLAFLGSLLFSLAMCGALGSLLLYFLLKPSDETALADKSQDCSVQELGRIPKHDVRQVSITTTHSITMGSERLCVESTEGFNAGETVEISSDAGMDLLVIRYIDRVHSSIVLRHAVSCTHPPGATVSQAPKDGSMLEDVFHSSQRRSLIAELFDTLDFDMDKMLNSEELSAFMKLADFKGTTSEGEEIVRAISCQSRKGCSLSQFTSLIDDHQGGWYYSDEKLKDLLNKAMAPQKGKRSQTTHSSQSAQDVMR